MTVHVNVHVPRPSVIPIPVPAHNRDVPAYVPHPEPVEVRHEKAARKLTVAWDDGHVSVFPLDYLRSWCP